MNASFSRALNQCFQRIMLLLVVSLMATTSAAFASPDQEAGDESPHALIDRVTSEVLTLVLDKKELLETDPDSLYLGIKQVLQPVVAFDYIANGVMGDYAKQASVEQRKRFSEAFQANLISTYAKGMALYANQKVETLPPEQQLGTRRKISVVQKIHGADADHMMVYSMGKSLRDNQWKLLNLIINGVNLGNTFRSQFDQAMKKEGDLDLVIDNWAS